MPSGSAWRSKRTLGDGSQEPTDPPVVQIPLSIPVRRGCRANHPPSNPTRRQPALGRTPLLKGRADLVPSSYGCTMGHHQAMPRPGKWYRKVSIKHDARYVSPLTNGIDNPSRRDLSTRVSTVTHTPEGMGQYIVPGVRLRMIKGDTKGWRKMKLYWRHP
jgi:hypothetical protein